VAIATAAPASDDDVPNRAMPETVYVLAPGSPTTEILSPTLKPSSSAVFLSSATWSAFVGSPPCTKRNALNGGRLTEARKFGAPPVLTRSPCLFWMETCWNTPPSATRTPSTASTFCTSDCGMGGEAWSEPKPDGFAPVTDTSTPWLAVSKTCENALSIVSVRTYVPEIIATPRTTASAVSAVRSLRAPSPRKT
jgi:hypothetical protein